MSTKFNLRPFTDSDWSCFSGCESADPMIGERDDLNLTVILDGKTIQLIRLDDKGSNDEVWSKDLFVEETVTEALLREVAEMLLNSTNPTVVAQTLGFERIN